MNRYPASPVCDVAGCLRTATRYSGDLWVCRPHAQIALAHALAEHDRQEGDEE